MSRVSHLHHRSTCEVLAWSRSGSPPSASFATETTLRGLSFAAFFNVLRKQFYHLTMMCSTIQAGFESTLVGLHPC